MVTSPIIFSLASNLQIYNLRQTKWDYMRRKMDLPPPTMNYRWLQLDPWTSVAGQATMQCSAGAVNSFQECLAGPRYHDLARMWNWMALLDVINHSNGGAPAYDTRNSVQLYIRPFKISGYFWLDWTSLDTQALAFGDEIRLDVWVIKQFDMVDYKTSPIVTDGTNHTGWDGKPACALTCADVFVDGSVFPIATPFKAGDARVKPFHVVKHWKRTITYSNFRQMKKRVKFKLKVPGHTVEWDYDTNGMAGMKLRNGHALYAIVSSDQSELSQHELEIRVKFAAHWKLVWKEAD